MYDKRTPASSSFRGLRCCTNYVSPTGSLDEENEQLVLEMFKYLKIQGTTIVLATHDDSVSQICDEVYHIHQECHQNLLA